MNSPHLIAFPGKDLSVTWKMKDGQLLGRTGDLLKVGVLEYALEFQPPEDPVLGRTSWRLTLPSGAVSRLGDPVSAMCAAEWDVRMRIVAANEQESNRDA